MQRNTEIMSSPDKTNSQLGKDTNSTIRNKCLTGPVLKNGEKIGQLRLENCF